MSLDTNFSRGLKLDPQTTTALSQFARRRRKLLLLRSVAGGLAFLILAMAFVATCDYLFLLTDGFRWTLSLVSYAIAFFAIWFLGLRLMGKHDPRAIARKLETADPQLREDLLSAVELADPNEANGSISFRNQLQHKVGRHSAGLDFGKVLPFKLIKRWLFSAALVTIAFITLFTIPQLQFARRIARAMLPMVAIERASSTEIAVLKPSPPSGFVAQGDAVAVVVQISGEPADEVWLQWITTDGLAGETNMTPRIIASEQTQNGTLDHQNTYAANLSIGTTPLRYRILAGDGITLWHELTPLPRPSVESFEKLYQFPSYAKLPDRVETAEHGDLKALSGSRVLLTVRFDEPVENVTIGFANRGIAPWELTAVEGSDRDFIATIPISSAANYQIDATSSRSGLNNPFSPQYSVTAVMDAPPAVRWGPSLPNTILASTIDVLPMQVIATDDLPFDDIVQEYKVNGGPLIRTPLAIEVPNRELELKWDWDLLNLVKDSPQSMQLSGGDIIQTRIVAIDRKGQAGASAFIEVLITEPGFDRNRHQHLIPMQTLTEAVAEWTQGVSELMQVASDEVTGTLNTTTEKATELNSQCEPLIQLVTRQLESSGKSIQSSEWELLARSITKLNRELNDWVSESTWVSEQDDEAWRDAQQRATRDLANRAKRMVQDASRINRYAQAIFGKTVSIGILDDTMALQKSITPLTNTPAPTSSNRLPIHIKVALGRLEAIERLIQQHMEALPDSTQTHLDNWTNWIDSWASRLQASIDESSSEEASRALLTNFKTELQNQYRSSIFDARLTATLSDMLRELQIQLSSSGDNVRKLLSSGEASVAAKKKREEAKGNSATSAQATKSLALSTLQFDLARESILKRLSQDETLHRRRLNLDPQYAADLNLMHRAIDNVTDNGFKPYRDENPTPIHQKLGYAFQTLESYHMAKRYLNELRELMLAERQLEENATSKIDHPHRLDRIGVGMEWPVHTMINAGIDPDAEVRKLDRLRYGPQFKAARQRISSRRWRDEQMIAADADLSDMEREYTSALNALNSGIEKARDTIRNYVLTLPEQAREAAEKVKQAEERTETRQDSSTDTAEELAEKQQEANEATQETLEALIDFANTASITDDAERELARDADAAAAQIQDAAQRAEESMEEAQEATDTEQRQQSLDQTAEALEQLADALEQTAAHFEAAEKGEEIEQSRDDLRQAEAALEMQNELDQRFDEAEQMAESAQSTPEELMEQLERELLTNEPMRQELSEIAQEAAESAQRELESAANKEQRLNQELEKSDPTIGEQKRRTAKQIENLAARTDALERALVEKAETALSKSQGNVPEAQQDLQKAREQLRDAVNEAAKLDAEASLLNEMQETAQAMTDAIKNAQQAIADAKPPTENAVQQKIHKDDTSRNRSKQQLEAAARDARSQQIRNATAERQQWSTAKREADRRANEAKNQKRTAENRKQQLEQQLSREKGNTDRLKEDIQQIQGQIENAASAEEAARETKSFAEKREQTAGKREQNARNQKLPPLDQPNPAAELASRLAEQTKNELGEIQEALRELSEGMVSEDQLRIPESIAEQLAQKQDKIQDQIDNATEQLRRAARHEERLGQDELAQQLAETADAIEQSASQAAEKASNTLQEAAESADRSPQANRDVADASEKISQAAQGLAEMLADSNPNDPGESSQQASQQGEQQASQQGEQQASQQGEQQASQQGEQQASQQGMAQNSEPNGQQPSQQSPSSPQGQPTAEQQEGQQMARTLDELDRAMAQQAQAAQQGEQQAGQQQSGQEQGQQQASEQQSQQPSGDQQADQQEGSQPGQQQTAGEASPTLANAMQSQAQQSARERQSQMNPAQPSPSEGSTPSTESGNGMQMPAGGPVDISQTNRFGTEWGKLRERRTEDASESRAESVAPQYRREIEAYFRAIAKRAAEKSK
ncbi:hypothetical protein OAF37_01490 [Rubripirellula sp.]|nr:hypothetical protein [Rubripirellula sp.]MDB4644708.1 hypothetical protein [Rubripirellula sp.]